MAAALQPVHVPLDVYLRSTFEPDAEYVNGVIEERNMGEWSHADWQAAVLEFFRNHRTDWAIRAVPELRAQVSERNYRVPDVTILDRTLPIEQIITHAPIAVVEILSPEDSLTRMMGKLNDYERMGIKNILILDPNGPHYIFENGALKPLPIEPYTLFGSKCRFDLDEVLKLRDS
jgi:Uma2 family endonuclease